ncbi:MAG: response regulator [Verrucomicrobia bacterium]|nr:response regulator [Verrucomicrobiota bacterium]
MKTAAIWLAIFLAGAAVGWLGYRARRTQMLGQLLDDARRSAVAIEPGDLRRLAGTRADVATAAYAALKDRLQKLRAVDPRVRVVHLYRFVPETGKVVYLGDSARSGARDESLPGDDYPPAAKSPGLQEIIRTGQAAAEGPLADDFGTWVAGYALIGEAPSTKPGVATKEILGLYVDAATWTGLLWRSAFQGAFFAWILLGLPFAALLVTRRQVEQGEVIRNLSEAMEQSRSAIVILDLECRVEYANRGLCQQIGYTRRELIGHGWRDLRVAQAADEVFADLTATVRAGRAWLGEWFNCRKDGSVYPVRGVVTPVKKRDGAIACFVAVFDDVTETKRREAELREALELAEAGDRAKGQFLATMSHEVRTPLNGIVGFTSLLLDTALTAEQREFVHTIRTSGEALIQLTGDILDFARIESAKLKLDPVSVDPRECVEDALDLLAGKAAEKNLELLHRTADDVPSAVVVDGGRVRQVLANLIGNAIKFTEHGDVEVNIAVTREGAGRRAEDGGRAAENREPDPEATSSGEIRGPASESCRLIFSVRDTGIGIAAEEHAKLFKPFSQLDDSTTRRYGGTGLGLAICRNLVHLMGGEIGFKSEPGQGSTFTFTLPALVATPGLPLRDLAGLRVGLAMRPGALRRELVRLLASWRAEVAEADTPGGLVPLAWDVGLVAVDEEVGREFALHPEPLAGLPPKKMVGLVPISCTSEMRVKLRTHFRLLVNKPVHQGELFALLSGSRPDAVAAPPPPAQFGFRVLVVEDNAVNQRLMQRVLANLGCRNTVVENGRRAIEELAQNAADYDLVLLDLHMPEMDGFAALEEIRSGRVGPRAQALWIIALTADARDEQRARGLAGGLNDYLTKPLKLPELETALRRFRDERGVRS